MKIQQIVPEPVNVLPPVRDALKIRIFSHAKRCRLPATGLNRSRGMRSVQSYWSVKGKTLWFPMLGDEAIRLVT
ncbi:hypothetical protein PQR37_41445, partial [Paraburkholderia nemoris]|uniref:hypothetical protein n=1 Tax=Paraburkholderia nemoris TaxID=2793076 RepID=UPI0038BD5FFB